MIKNLPRKGLLLTKQPFRFFYLHFYLFTYFLLIIPAEFAKAQSYVARTGPPAIHQEALDLGSNLNVLNIAIQPGYEDLSTLTYFRLGLGADITTVYITDGEAGTDDYTYDYPHLLSALHQRNALQAMSYLDIKTRFLSYPNIVAAINEDKINTLWYGDSLSRYLHSLVQEHKPDIIIFNLDWQQKERSLIANFVLKTILDCIKKLETEQNNRNADRLALWTKSDIKHVLTEQLSLNGLTFPYDSLHPVFQETYKTIRAGLGGHYKWSRSQQLRQSSNIRTSYSIAYPERYANQRILPYPFTSPPSRRLIKLEERIQNISRIIRRNKYDFKSDISGKRIILENISSLINDVDSCIRSVYHLIGRERRCLLKWKNGLENLRSLIRNVSITFSVSDSILTERQLVYIEIDTVTGDGIDGQLKLIFPKVNEGWIVNESNSMELPLDLHKSYRIVTPPRVDYTYPASLYRSQLRTEHNIFPVILYHKGKKSEDNFAYRQNIIFQFAPRFTVELSEPILFLNSRSQISVRLTNNSRDGVSDSINLMSPYLTSASRRFRLNGKGSSEVINLKCSSDSSLPEGEYIVQVGIGGVPLVHFLGRKIDIQLDPSRSIGILTNHEDSPIVRTLRQLNLNPQIIKNVKSEGIKGFDVLILDTRSQEFFNEYLSDQGEMQSFFDSGGHFIILSQVDSIWNTNPLIPGIRLKGTFSIDEEVQVSIDSQDSVASKPNIIYSDDFDGWVFAKALNTIFLDDDNSFYTHIKTSNGQGPLLVSKPAERGLMIYVGLHLDPQLLNVHPGAIRLISNLISYK